MRCNQQCSGRITLFSLFVVSLVASSAAAQGLEHVKANYTKYEYLIPMRDGKRLFTAVYIPKEQAQQYPILLMRTPYSASPYGADQYRADLGPSPLFGKEGYIFAYQDVRGRWMSEGEFVDMRPHRAEKSRPTDFDESTDTWDTIDWLIKTRTRPQRQSRHVGHLVSRLLHLRRHHRGTSGPQGGLAPSTDPGLVRRRRLASQRGVVPAPRFQLHGAVLVMPGRTRPRSLITPSTMAHRTDTSSFCAWERCPTPIPAISRTRSPFGMRRCSTESMTSSGRAAAPART